MEDVEMAQDEVFSGPMSESVPTSVSGFRHRRSRADSSASLTSFAFYDEEQDSGEGTEDEDSAILEDGESEYNGYAQEDSEDTEDLEAGLSSPSPTPSRRKSSGGSRRSSERPLLRRRQSSASTGSGTDFSVLPLSIQKLPATCCSAEPRSFALAGRMKTTLTMKPLR
jgi:cation-transporting ATPase 13A2